MIPRLEAHPPARQLRRSSDSPMPSSPNSAVYSVYSQSQYSDSSESTLASSIDDVHISKPLRPGVYVPTVTFFRKDNEDLDLETISQHAVRLAQAGVAGLTTQGSNGEAVHLTHKERKLVTKTTRVALDRAGFHSVPIIVGCGSQSTRETIDLCHEALQSGGDYALVLPPSYYKPLFSATSLVEFFQDVADSSPIPILIYNYPGAVAGIDMDSDVITRLAKHPNIVGCKLTCGNTGKLARVAASVGAATPTENGSGFMCMGGSADFTLQTLIVGGSGVICGLGNVTPKACVRVIELYTQGKLAEAQKLQTAVARGDWAAISGGIVGTKSALETYYGYGGYARKPLPRPTKQEAANYANDFPASLGAFDKPIGTDQHCYTKVRAQTVAGSVHPQPDAHLPNLTTATMGGGADPQPENLLVILPFPEPVDIFERIKKNHPQIRITFRRLAFGTFDEGLKEIPKELFHDATILVTLSSLPKSPEDCPNLELIHFFSAGINHVAHSPIYTHTSIPLTTSSGIHGPQIAEWVTMTALVRSHSYNLLHDWQTQHHWGKGSSHPALRSNRDYVGQHLGVLGYGSIGRQVARVCSAMGMSVIAYTAHPRPTPTSKRDPGFIVPNTGDPDGTIPSAWYSGLDKPSLHNFLSQDIDILLISVPLTTSTTHLLGKEEFDILARRNAFVSNISRGQILVQEALIAALREFEEGVREGRKGPELKGLRGAALDVTDPEPLPEQHELWRAPNCIVTPHVSGLGSAYADRAFQVLEVNLDRRERGEKMINVVDRKEGY